jgi:hypothetical protein
MNQVGKLDFPLDPRSSLGSGFTCAEKLGSSLGVMSAIFYFMPPALRRRRRVVITVLVIVGVPLIETISRQ